MENVLCFSAFHWPRKENVSDFSWDCFVLLESTQCLYIDFHWDVPVSEGLFYASLQHHQWEIYIMQWLVCKSWVNPPNTGMLRDRSTDEEKETVRWDKRDPETERVETDTTLFHCGLASRPPTEEGFVSWGAFPPLPSSPIFPPPSSAWLSLTKDMFKVDFALQGSNRKLQPENHKPKADRAETPWLRNISALETPHTFPLESLITAWASRSSCQCCCHGNMVCMRERESERQQPPQPHLCEISIIGVWCWAVLEPLNWGFASVTRLLAWIQPQEADGTQSVVTHLSYL